MKAPRFLASLGMTFTSIKKEKRRGNRKNHYWLNACMPRRFIIFAIIVILSEAKDLTAIKIINYYRYGRIEEESAGKLTANCELSNCQLTT